MLIDTSVLVGVFRDETGDAGRRFRTLVRRRRYALTRFTQLELLQGCNDEGEWEQLEDYLRDQYYAEMTPPLWQRAGRTFFELRRQGKTVRSVIDCCIAELAIEYGLTLLHHDRDFGAIAAVRPLKAKQVDITRD